MRPGPPRLPYFLGIRSRYGRIDLNHIILVPFSLPLTIVFLARQLPRPNFGKPIGAVLLFGLAPGFAWAQRLVNHASLTVDASPYYLQNALL